MTPRPRLARDRRAVDCRAEADPAAQSLTLQRRAASIMGRLARCEQGTAVGAAIGVMVFGMIAAGAALAVDGVTDYGAALVEAAEAAQAAAEAARDEAIAACVAAGGTGCG